MVSKPYIYLTFGKFPLPTEIVENYPHYEKNPICYLHHPNPHELQQPAETPKNRTQQPTAPGGKKPSFTRSTPQLQRHQRGRRWRPQRIIESWITSKAWGQYGMVEPHLRLAERRQWLRHQRLSYHLEENSARWKI